MQPRLPVGGMAHGRKQHLVFEEIAVLDRLVDARNLLVHNPACPEVHVAHLGVSHLAAG